MASMRGGRWLLWLLVAGCSHQGLSGGNSDGAVAASDAAQPGSDGTSPLDGSICTSYVFEPTALDMLQPVEFVSHHGQAIRVMLMVPLRAGCDLMGPVAVSYAPGNATDFVQVVAHRWRQVGGDCPPPDRVPYVLLLDGSQLSNPRLDVADAAPGGTAVIDLQIDPPPPGDCATPVTNQCDLSCQCRNSLGPGVECIGGFCRVSCNGDDDCAGQKDAPACGTLEGTPFACGPAFQCPMSCPFGQACGPSLACRPVPPDMPLCSFPNCACDAECGRGELCAGSRCVIPCAGSSDCPFQANCDPQGQCEVACGG